MELARWILSRVLVKLSRSSLRTVPNYAAGKETRALMAPKVASYIVSGS
jgi:hypothetical protein